MKGRRWVGPQEPSEGHRGPGACLRSACLRSALTKYLREEYPIGGILTLQGFRARIDRARVELLALRVAGGDKALRGAVRE